MQFSDLQLIPELLQAIQKEGYEEPTPIQVQAIPAALQGRDILGCAQTGTGKTAAFALPILQKLYQDSLFHADTKKMYRPVRALIMTPTRELAVQIGDSFAAYGRFSGLRTAVIFGGVPQRTQTHALTRGVDIIVATPGRLNDLMEQGFLDYSFLEFLVLDEADRMLDMGFSQDVKKIIKHLPKEKQTLFFSATMPDEVKELVDSLLQNPERIMVNPVSSTVELIRQVLYKVDKKNKAQLLIHLLETEDIESALVFTRTKRGADVLTKKLVDANVRAQAIHGDKSQNARQRALNNFKDGRLRILVATDIAARGIDIDGLSHAVNYDLPETPEAYVHRIGRTGRAGLAGTAISFCCIDEFSHLKSIEKLTKTQLDEVEDHPFPMEILEPSEPKKPRPPRKKSSSSSFSKPKTESAKKDLSGNQKRRSFGEKPKKEGNTEKEKSPFSRGKHTPYKSDKKPTWNKKKKSNIKK